MRAAALDRSVTIQQRTLTRNAYGEQVESYGTRATVWGQRLDVAGREMLAARGTIAEQTARFRLRYRDDLSVTDRLVCEGKTYDIVQISELGRGEGLEVVAIARVT